jgi:hypothetical protein
VQSLSTAGRVATLGEDRAGFRRDRPRQGDLEFLGGLADASFERRLDREPHATVEEGGGEAAMHGAERVEQRIRRRRRDDDAAVFRFRDVVAQRAGDGVE